MKFIYGPGINELKIFTDAGEEISQQLCISHLSFCVHGPDNIPKIEITCEVWGNTTVEIDTKAENVAAFLNGLGITPVYTPEKVEEELTLADIHSDPGQG